MEMNIQNEEQLPILVDRIMNMISQSFRGRKDYLE